MQTVQSNNQEETKKKQKKPSRFDNLLADSIYNIIVWLPVTIISWILSQLDFQIDKRAESFFATFLAGANKGLNLF